jgi:hypothetical protein
MWYFMIKDENQSFQYQIQVVAHRKAFFFSDFYLICYYHSGKTIKNHEIVIIITNSLHE